MKIDSTAPQGINTPPVVENFLYYSGAPKRLNGADLVEAKKNLVNPEGWYGWHQGVYPAAEFRLVKNNASKDESYSVIGKSFDIDSLRRVPFEGTLTLGKGDNFTMTVTRGLAGVAQKSFTGVLTKDGDDFTLDFGRGSNAFPGQLFHNFPDLSA